MSNFRVYGDDAERVIDRSGDIDQRPPEERSVKPAKIVVFRPNPPSEAEPVARLRRLDDEQLPAPTPVSREAPSAALADVAISAQAAIDRQFVKAKAHLDACAQKIEAKEKKCALPRLDGDLQQLRFQRQKSLIANGPALASHLREERSRLADLERFKAETGIARDAHYPASPILGFGILSILVLVEACINGVLFAETSDRGLFGGWLEAMALAITNVGVAFLVGSIILPQLNRRSLPAKAAGGLLALAGLAALVAVNLFGAHYRDFKATAAKAELAAQAVAAPRRETSAPIIGQKPASETPGFKAPPPPFPSAAAEAAKRALAEEKGKRSEMEALRKVFQAPFEIESFTSLFLLIIGLCAATVAAADGYKFDDPCPGYGKRHRRYAEAREASAAALRRVLGNANAGIAANFQSIDRKLETCAQELAELAALRDAYAGDCAAFRTALDEAARAGEAGIARHDRLLNKIPDRTALDRYALSAPALPQLNEKHAKFAESQEKKLKALQKTVQKEKNESLGVFEAAAQDFEKLLAEVVQASLQTAPPPPPPRGLPNDGEDGAWRRPRCRRPRPRGRRFFRGAKLRAAEARSRDPLSRRGREGHRAHHRRQDGPAGARGAVARPPDHRG